MRIIPRTAKIKIQFFKNISILDIIIALSFLGLIVLLVVTNIGFVRFILMAIVLVIGIGLFYPFEGQRFYIFLAYGVKYVFSVKKFTKNETKTQTNIDNYLPYKDIRDGYIEYATYSAGVLQIDPREFSLLSEFRQNQMIDENFGRIIREIVDHTKASLVKIDRKVSFEQYIKYEEQKRDNLQALFDKGELSEDELYSRISVINDRIRAYTELTDETPVIKPFYYLVVYDQNKAVIDEILNDAILTF